MARLLSWWPLFVLLPAADAAELDVAAGADVIVLDDEVEEYEVDDVEDGAVDVDVDVVDESEVDVAEANWLALAAETCDPTTDVTDVKIETASEMRTLSKLLDWPETLAANPTINHKVEVFILSGQRIQQQIMIWT